MKVRKVSESCQELVSSGFMSHDEALRITLVAAMLPTLDRPCHPVSADVLMSAVGLDREEFASQLEVLASQGIATEYVSDAGYRLSETLDDLLIPEAVVPQLLARTDSVDTRAGNPPAGLPYLYSARCGSTNKLLKSEGKRLPSGAVAVTDDQTEGRGRLGRTWSSEPGKDLTFSVLLRPSALTHEATLLSLTTGLAVAEVLERLPGLRGRVRIKWPNDVLIDDRKVCGILLESWSQSADLQWVVAGIGLNVNSDPGSRLKVLEPSQREVWRGRPMPTSVRSESGRSVGRGILLAELLTTLSDRWFEASIADSLGELRLRDGLVGRQVEVHGGPPDGALIVAGEAVGIDDRGELLVRDRNGRTTSVAAGETTLSVDSPVA